MDLNYDEFGNYIGNDPQMIVDDTDDDDAASVVPSAPLEVSNAVVVHDATRQFRTAQEVYGEGAEVLVEYEDAHGLDRGVLFDADAAASNMFTLAQEKEMLPTGGCFMQELCRVPMLQRNVVILGHMHHGKTSICDVLMDSQDRFLDARKDEAARGVSVKSHLATMLATTTQGKTLLLTVLDTPGHVSFDDEVVCGASVADGAVCVVDVAEGVMKGTLRALDHAIRLGLPVVLLLNKMDRLILELHLPPNDAAMKIRNVINTVNAHIVGHPLRTPATKTVSPEDGNVVFGSSTQRWFFTLQTFAKLYCARNGNIADSVGFSHRLWGPWVLAGGKLTKTPARTDNAKPAFVALVLEPLYKVASQALGEEVEFAGLTEEERVMDIKPLLRVCYERFFGGAAGGAPIIDAIWSHVPSPEQTPSFAIGGPLRAHVPKFLHFQNRESASQEMRLFAMARIVTGSLVKGNRVSLVDCSGDGASTEVGDVVINEMFLSLGRTLLPIDEAVAGTVVVLGDVKQQIVKHGVVHAGGTNGEPFLPLRHALKPVIKIGVEALRPSDHMKMIEGLRVAQQAFPSLTLVVEDTGEHVLYGTGELYLDTVMMDLRTTYAKIEIKVSDPGTSFRETVDRPTKSAYTRFTQNKTNSFSFVANAMEKGIVKAFDMQRVSPLVLRQEFKWDALSVKSIWAFGPGPNILLNDTLPQDVNKVHLETIRPHIVAGFNWAMREGPLCGEPVFNTRVRLTHAMLSTDAMEREMRIVLPTTRHGIFGALLESAPRLMEPIFTMEIQTTSKARKAVYAVLAQRRGKVVNESACPGLPLLLLTAVVPVMESFGLETEIRVHTSGEAFCQCEFSHWDVVPGDPRISVPIKVTEAVPAHKLARDFFLKTRRRKGMSEEISF